MLRNIRNNDLHICFETKTPNYDFKSDECCELCANFEFNLIRHEKSCSSSLWKTFIYLHIKTSLPATTAKLLQLIIKFDRSRLSIGKLQH